MANNWADFRDWGYVLPPNRPTESFLQLIAQECTRRTRLERVAVLGSTPELRDLIALRTGAEVWVFERDEAYKQRVDRLRVAQGSLETIVLGDWRETLSGYRDHFDLILSDLTSGNVPYADRPAFYHDVAFALRPSGTFIDRVLMSGGRDRLDDLDQRFRCSGNNILSYNNYSSMYLFGSELLAGRETVDSSEFYETLRTRHEGDAHLLALWTGAHLVTPPGAVWYYGRDWSALEHDYERHFAGRYVRDDDAGTAFTDRTKLIVSSREG